MPAAGPVPVQETETAREGERQVGQQQSARATREPGAADGPATTALTATAARPAIVAESAGDRPRGEASVELRDAPTVEELLEEGLRLVGASPVHLAIRGTAGATTVRCAWRGIARTTAQREDAIRFWLRLGATEAIPSAGDLEELFTATFDVLNPEYRETAKANFLAIARGGLSEEYLFLTCFADYAVTAYLLGTGTTPGTVTVAYDNRGEARSYELYRREHEAGTYGADALRARGDYEASLQEIVVAAEEALAAEIGSKERIVFLAPIGAHHAIAFEAWQAVAHWDLASKSLTGTIPAGLSHLFELTTLDLSSNRLTGAIPAELGWLTNLTELRFPGT